MDSFDEGSSEEETYSEIVHEMAHKPRRIWFHHWIEEHFEVISDLYIGFKRDGEKVFGRSFNQLGSFANYAEFIFTFTVLQQPDLLKAGVEGGHVGTLGSSTRS